MGVITERRISFLSLSLSYPFPVKKKLIPMKIDFKQKFQVCWSSSIVEGGDGMRYALQVDIPMVAKDRFVGAICMCPCPY